ncbi:MAG: hypothetical protein K2L82_04305 [Lachnospiraceae bacterium]|nr:hypothetical protein [Lachnospiraceae bacterium]
MGYNVHVSIERCQTMRWQNDCLQSILTDYRMIGRKPVSEKERSGGERAARGSGTRKPVSEKKRSGGERAARGSGTRKPVSSAGKRI